MRSTADMYRGQWMASRKRANALRKALVRLLWDSIADDAACSCELLDICPQCEAMQALGYKRWPGAKKAEKWLARYQPVTGEAKREARAGKGKT